MPSIATRLSLAPVLNSFERLYWMYSRNETALLFPSDTLPNFGLPPPMDRHLVNAHQNRISGDVHPQLQHVEDWEPYASTERPTAVLENDQWQQGQGENPHPMRPALGQTMSPQRETRRFCTIASDDDEIVSSPYQHDNAAYNPTIGCETTDARHRRAYAQPLPTLSHFGDSTEKRLPTYIHIVGRDVADPRTVVVAQEIQIAEPQPVLACRNDVVAALEEAAAHQDRPSGRVPSYACYEHARDGLGCFGGRIAGMQGSWDPFCDW